MRQETIELIRRKKLIAIVRGATCAELETAAAILRECGVELIEVTFDQSSPALWDETCKSISALTAAGICAGAGTVLSPEQARLARDAGARYIISPDCNPDVIRVTRELGMASIPGALTPTEIAAAHNAGADFVKVFPVSNMGTSYIKAVRAPLSHIPLLAVGGVNADNIAEYLKAGCAGAGVGSSLIDLKAIRSGNPEALRANAAKYTEAIAKYDSEVTRA